MQPERITILKGTNRDPDFLFGPLPALRQGNVVAYEFELPERFEPWPGRSRVERSFVLLDVGVGFSVPCWRRATKADGSVAEIDPHGRDSWYVDLLKVEPHGTGFIIRDLYIDVVVPTDGRHYRMLDLDEYADAMADGTLSIPDAIDGLRRWQRFLDGYLHSGRWPLAGWSDFPPQAIADLAAWPGLFGTPVQWRD